MTTIEQKRKFVYECLHYQGNLRASIDRTNYVLAYLFCDGTGKITIVQAIESAFAWSHVFDSTEDGIDTAFEFLSSLFKRAD